MYGFICSFAPPPTQSSEHIFQSITDIASHSCYELFFSASHIFGTDRLSLLAPKLNT